MAAKLCDSCKSATATGGAHKDCHHVDPKKIQRIIAIPDEMILEILSRLPVKTLRRFKCVCKSWCSMISNTELVRLHSTRFTHVIYAPWRKDAHTSRAIRVLTVIRGSDHDHSSIIFPSLLHYDHSSIKFPSLLHNSWYVGCCNGWFLFFIKRYKQLISYRIIDGAYREIPWPLPHKSSRCFGFGYDSKSDDFKVVLMNRRSIITNGEAKYSDSAEQEIKFYSFEANSWRTILQEKLPWASYHVEYNKGGNNFVNNALHWAVKEPKTRRIYTIACFDIHAESLYEISPPNFDEHYFQMDEKPRNFIQELAVLGERLHFTNFDVFKSRLDVWVMKEYGVQESWVHLCRVDEDCFPTLRPVMYGQEGRLILFREGIYGPPCYWFDLGHKTKKHFAHHLQASW